MSTVMRQGARGYFSLVGRWPHICNVNFNTPYLLGDEVSTGYLE